MGTIDFGDFADEVVGEKGFLEHFFEIMDIADGEGHIKDDAAVTAAQVEVQALTQTFVNGIESATPESIKSWLRDAFTKKYK